MAGTLQLYWQAPDCSNSDLPDVNLWSVIGMCTHFVLVSMIVYALTSSLQYRARVVAVQYVHIFNVAWCLVAIQEHDCNTKSIAFSGRLCMHNS